MPSIRIDKDLNDEMYFVTLTIRNWYHVFDRHGRWEILADSLKYCQDKKGLKIYGYVFMPNHIHLIIQAFDVSGVLRDFKRFTAQELLKNFLATEARLHDLFATENGKHQFWEHDNMPKLIETDHYFEQKLNYIHDNPVRKQNVAEPEYWYWSSASFHILHEEGPIVIETEF